MDFSDCPSGGLVLAQTIPRGPSCQVPFAARIGREAGIATGAVGWITMTRQVEEIIHAGQADAFLIARQSLRAPYQIVASALDRHAQIRIMMNDGRIMLPKGVFMAENAYLIGMNPAPRIRIPIVLREQIEQSARRYRRRLNQGVIRFSHGGG